MQAGSYRGGADPQQVLAEADQYSGEGVGCAGWCHPVLVARSGPGWVGWFWSGAGIAGQTGLSKTMWGEAHALVSRNQDEVAESVAGVGPGGPFAC